MFRPYLFVFIVFFAVSGCPTAPNPPPEPVVELPFSYTRPTSGEALSATDVDAFTQEAIAFFKGPAFYDWALEMSHGLDPSYSPDMPDYLLWWTQAQVIKSGGKVRFYHADGEDNATAAQTKVWTQALALYLSGANGAPRTLSQGYARGMVALFKSLEFSPEDSAVALIPRAMFTHNHSYTTHLGHLKSVDYSGIKVPSKGWNAHTINNPKNPTYGDIWVRNMRSKDDVCDIFRAYPFVAYAATRARDPDVKADLERAQDYLKRFAQDIVDQGYFIRTREDGVTYTPTEELASFNTVTPLFPRAECINRLSAYLIARGSAPDYSCGDGYVTEFERAAAAVHYYNTLINQYYHLSAIGLALLHRQDDVARRLLEGFDTRLKELDTDAYHFRETHHASYADLATLYVAAAGVGTPLTHTEARFVQAEYRRAFAFFGAYKNWNFWSDSVPDGTYRRSFPERTVFDTQGTLVKSHIRVEELGYLFELCASPWKNPAGSLPVNCTALLDAFRDSP